MTALLGVVSGLEGWWLAAFIAGVFGVTFSALYGASRVALNVIPERLVRRPQPQQSGGFTAGLLDMAATEERKKLRAAIQRIAGEVAYGRKMVLDAEASGSYWHPNLRSIPNDAWMEYSQVLAESPEALEAYQAAEAAYHEFDRINHTVESLPMPPDGAIHVRPGDRLEDATGAAQAAEATLRGTVAAL